MERSSRRLIGCFFFELMQHQLGLTDPHFPFIDRSSFSSKIVHKLPALSQTKHHLQKQMKPPRPFIRIYTITTIATLKGEHYGKHLTIFTDRRIGHGTTPRTDGHHEKTK